MLGPGSLLRCCCCCLQDAAAPLQLTMPPGRRRAAPDPCVPAACLGRAAATSRSTPSTPREAGRLLWPSWRWRRWPAPACSKGVEGPCPPCGGGVPHKGDMPGDQRPWGTSVTACSLWQGFPGASVRSSQRVQERSMPLLDNSSSPALSSAHAASLIRVQDPQCHNVHATLGRGRACTRSYSVCLSRCC